MDSAFVELIAKWGVFPALLVYAASLLLPKLFAARSEMAGEGARTDVIEGEPRRGGNRASAEPWVADLRIGYAIGDRDWTLSYALIRRSSEFKSANGSRCCGETYAAISLALTW